MTTHFPSELELLVMMTAGRLGSAEAHVGSIVEDIFREKGRRVEAIEVEATLVALEGRGLVSTRIDATEDDLPCDPIRWVTVEPKGSATVDAATLAVRAMLDDLVMGDGTAH